MQLCIKIRPYNRIFTKGISGLLVLLLPKETSLDGSLTWLSSFSAASLRFGSMVPFRACMIRLGSIRPDSID